MFEIPMMTSNFMIPFIYFAIVFVCLFVSVTLFEEENMGKQFNATARKSTTYVPDKLRNPRNRNIGSKNQASQSKSSRARIAAARKSTTSVPESLPKPKDRNSCPQNQSDQERDFKVEDHQKNPNKKEKDDGQSK